jgi:hypothetical protein
LGWHISNKGGFNSYQGMNIDAAQFQSADLWTLDHDSLTSANFQTPPTYDDQTRFPTRLRPRRRRLEAHPLVQRLIPFIIDPSRLPEPPA